MALHQWPTVVLPESSKGRGRLLSPGVMGKSGRRLVARFYLWKLDL